MDVDITTFVSPHFFYVIEKSFNKRKNFLRNIGELIKNGPIQVPNPCFDVNEIVGVCYDNEFVRAKIEDIQFECNTKLYYCWLLDYGFLIKSGTVFKVSNEAKENEPLAKQVLLNNIAYLQSTLELGLNGKVQNSPTTIPSPGVSEYCFNLISGYTKIYLKVLSYSGKIIIGELFIHKNNKVINLSDELIKQGLLVRDSVIFETLKKEATYYMMNHINVIYHSARNISACNNKVEDHDIIWEDSVAGSVLENGRRRFKSKLTIGQAEQNVVAKMETDKKLEGNADNSQKSTINVDSSGSQKNTVPSCAENNQINNPRLLLKLKQKSLLKTNIIQGAQDYCSHKTESLPASDMKLSVNILRKRIADIKGHSEPCRDMKIDTDNKSSSEGIIENTGNKKKSSHLSQIEKSPFSDITSQNGNKPKLNLLPAGIGIQKKSLNIKRCSSNQSNASYSMASESDCPTVKVKKQSSRTENSSKHQTRTTDSSSTTSENEPRMFTKRDFCGIISGGCKCKDCQMPFEDEDWESSSNFTQSSGISKTKLKEGPIIKPSRLLKEETEKYAPEKTHIVSVNYDKMTALQKLGANKLLVHGQSIPQPAKLVSDINIDLDIYNSISRLNYKETKKIQQYAFPALIENQHVFMINNTNSGKTMAYLPIVISFIKGKNERYNPLLKLSGGPIVVILCSSSKKCEEIYDLSRMILDKQKCRLNLVTYPGHGNISNVDILITIPTILGSLILSRAINFKRLCHFVLEDADKILNLHKELIDKFLLYADQVLENRHCPISVQVIVCAEHWTYDIEIILKRLNKIPLVCIGNYLEAALYGKMNFTMKFLEASRKIEQLKDTLEDVFMYTKSIVICNSNEVYKIETYFILKGIVYITIKDEMIQEDMQFYESKWNNCLPGNYSVLICTDKVYNTLSVTNASLLIHFSLPKTWTQFIKRFSCLLENIASPLHTKEISVSSFVFIDENCEPKMSKFSQFINSSDLEKYLPEKLKTYFEGVEAINEDNKAEQKIELCDKLKMFGHCSSVQCLNRHIINKEVDISDYLPKSGYIKFKIQLMTNTTTASIKLLEHLDLNGTSVKVFEDLSFQIADTLQKDREYASAQDLKTSDLYLYQEKNEYFRCKLIEKRDFLLVFLLDIGIYSRAEPSQMFIMPQELKNIPQQCFEVYFANLVPPYDDPTFCRLSKNKAQLLVKIKCSKVKMKGLIKLQLSDNLWLSDVCEEREMFDKSLPTVGFQLTRELVEAGLAVHKINTINELYTVVKAANIELPQYIKTTVPKPVVEVQVEPQWAFLDIEDITEVMFSCAVNPEEFYIRNAKFHNQLLDLEKYILKEIQRPFYPKLTCLVVGKCYLAKDEQSDNYSRVLLLEEDNDQAHVFCVDYGDSLIVTSSTLKYLRNDMIKRLPFQAIQCSLFGVQPIEPNKWGKETIDLLYERGFEPGTDVFRALYAKVQSKSDNSKIERQNSYRVLIKDGYSENRFLLNTLFIDCGFAISDGNIITDFNIDAFYQVDDEEILTDEDIENISVTPANHLVENGYIGNLDDFELMIVDIEKFLTDLNIISPVAAKQTENCDTSNKCIDNNLPAIKAAPPVNFLTPDVLWFQTNSHIKLTIKIHDVNDCILNLLGKRIFFFSTEKNQKKYKIKLMFFDDVEKTFQHTILGSEIRVTFKKCADAEWPRLLSSNEKNKKVRYDVLKIKDDEKTKRFLDLELDESSSEDENGPAYHVCSDMDSEYDFDIAHDTY